MGRAATTGSTVPRRELGRYLAAARKRVHLSAKDAAAALDRSTGTIWRIETGRVPVRVPDVEKMCQIYDVPSDMTGALVALAQETKSRGWWHAYGDVVAEWFNIYVGLEEAAAALRFYAPDLVPGLMQTADYARTITQALAPESSPEEVTRLVDFRMSRQTLLTRSTAPLHVEVVVEEVVLRRPIGAPRVVAEQCRRLAELSDLPHVDLRILPLSTGLHPGVRSGRFVILDFPLVDGGREHSEPTTVYVEGETGALYLDQPGEVEQFERTFQQITQASGENAARRSRELLWQIAQEVME